MPRVPRNSHLIGADPLTDIAHVFAKGVLRLVAEGRLPGRPEGLSPQTALTTAAQGLEQPATTRLSVHRGLRTETTRERKTE